jgi:hypothetical protein
MRVTSLADTRDSSKGVRRTGIFAVVGIERCSNENGAGTRRDGPSEAISESCVTRSNLAHALPSGAGALEYVGSS